MKFSLATMLLVLTVPTVFVALWPKFGCLELLLVAVSSVLILIFSCVFRTRFPKRFRNLAVVLILGLAAFALSIGPSTRFVIINNIDRGPASFVRIYRTIYLPVTDFIAAFPEPVRELSNRYVSWWLPKDVSIDDRWPKQEPLLISWEEPNRGAKLWHGIPRNEP